MSGKKPRKVAFCASVGLEFASAVIIGVLIGIWLDKRFCAPPLFLIIFFLFGCAAGYVNILKYMKKQDRQE
ncbi:MAG: AtpZ/AtpI family protein [Holosporaceae bacterium]|nr:AtpZ/AtpI family protein [Holosporaceae bacterium]